MVAALDLNPTGFLGSTLRLRTVLVDCENLGKPRKFSTSRVSGTATFLPMPTAKQ